MNGFFLSQAELQLLNICTNELTRLKRG
jgi:hypothetical protein